MSLLNIWGHIATVPACSSDTLTNVLPHRNAMPQTHDTTPLPITVYRHRADMSLCYPLMWNITLEYTATHFNVLGQIRPGNPSPTFRTHQQRSTNAGMSVRSLVESVPYLSSLEPGTCGVWIHYAIRSPTVSRAKHRDDKASYEEFCDKFNCMSYLLTLSFIYVLLQDSFWNKALA